MEEIGYFVVTVKISIEQGYNQKKQEPIIKRVTDKYLVKAGSPEDAVKIVEDDFKDFSDEWRIFSVVESNISKVL